MDYDEVQLLCHDIVLSSFEILAFVRLVRCVTLSTAKKVKAILTSYDLSSVISSTLSSSQKTWTFKTFFLKKNHTKFGMLNRQRTVFNSCFWYEISEKNRKFCGCNLSIIPLCFVMSTRPLTRQCSHRPFIRLGRTFPMTTHSSNKVAD